MRFTVRAGPGWGPPARLDLGLSRLAQGNPDIFFGPVVTVASPGLRTHCSRQSDAGRSARRLAEAQPP
ncbi:hypothetical protein RR42_m3871 [Cupriavidus basilensis]|uniref:Uncharacterized protein n=1 Tax=Cupriavidus basilensis TaxID=68895 RepID=A0A0C4YEQ0_9BURK|nr:hypothetical protein RR42_m3871 [Cupriavidus basilensis]